MLADQPIIISANADVLRKNGPALRRMVRINPAAPAAALPAWGEDGWTALLEYAAFLLDQEAKYCQQ